MKYAIAAALIASAQAWTPYKSGEIKTWESFQYGRFVTSMQVQLKKGTNQSFFTFWDGPDWQYGEWNEIDVEIVPSVSDAPFSTNLIYGNGTDKLMDAATVSDQIGAYQYNTYDIRWTPDYVEFWLNDNLVRRIDGSHESVWRMNKSQKLYMNFWTPTFPGWGDDFSDAEMPFYAWYDFVEVYKWNWERKKK